MWRKVAIGVIFFLKGIRWIMLSLEVKRKSVKSCDEARPGKLGNHVNCLLGERHLQYNAPFVGSQLVITPNLPQRYTWRLVLTTRQYMMIESEIGEIDLGSLALALTGLFMALVSIDVGCWRSERGGGGGSGRGEERKDRDKELSY